MLFSFHASLSWSGPQSNISCYVTVRGLNRKYSSVTVDTASHEKQKMADKDSTKNVLKEETVAKWKLVRQTALADQRGIKVLEVCTRTIFPLLHKTLMNFCII